MKASKSKRIELLQKALNFFNAGKWDEQDGCIVFGTTFANLEDSAFGELEEDDVDPPIVQVIETYKVEEFRERGQVELIGRTSLDQPPQFAGNFNATKNALKNLPPKDRENLEMAVALSQIENHEKPEPSDAQIAAKNRDALEARLAEQMLGKLPKASGRAFGLQKLSVDSIPQEVQRYFGEAHECWKYGFPIACALLCRALMESSLRSECDPDKNIEKLEELARKAIGLGKVKSVKIEDCNSIRDAGNDAAHGLKNFKKEREATLAKNLENTRRILIDLYSKSEV